MQPFAIITKARELGDKLRRLEAQQDESALDALCRAAAREAPGVPVVLEKWRGEWRADVRQVRRRA